MEGFSREQASLFWYSLCMKTIACIGCGAQVPDIDGPTHKYLGASPGCWKIYSDVLAKEYGDPEYMKVHRLTVDAYSLQHLGTESPQTIQSMNLHLMALCAALEHNVEYDFIPKIMNRRLKEYKDKEIFSWLNPPPSLGSITIVEVAKATTLREHTEIVNAWARDVWQQWHEHHELIEEYLGDVSY